MSCAILGDSYSLSSESVNAKSSYKVSGQLSRSTIKESGAKSREVTNFSNIEGDTVSIQAGRDISLTGTNALSDSGTQLSAGRDVSILAAKNTFSESSSKQEKKKGIFGSEGSKGFTIGKQQTDDSNDKTARTHSASKVGAIDGNVIIDAGHTYQQTGSNLVAGMGADTGKDIKDANRGNAVVRAQDINIDNNMNVTTTQSEQRFKQSGLTVSVSNSLIDNAKAIDSLIDAGGNTQSTRMKTMAGVTAALKTQALAEQATKGAKGLASGINAQSLQNMGNTRIQATIGSSKNQSNSSSVTEANQGSSITTNNLALTATGAGSDSNININGSNLTVSNDALFQAGNDLNVNGVAQNSNTRSNNKSSSAAIGAYASTGNGMGITASASRAKGYANSDSTTYANSQINVGGTSTFDIGNDVNIKGGVINTGRAQGAIGGDVTIESLQDTATYDSKQKNMGFSADIDIAGGGAGSSLSVNGGKTNLNADHQAVGEQSGIFTGDGGLDIAAGGKTTLVGGAITTTEAARDAGRNRYTSADGIKTQNINNTTSYDGNAIQVGVSFGQTDNKPQASMNGLGYGKDSDSDSSVTRAGITGIAGSQDITTDNRAEYAGILENSFDAGRVNEELGAQTEITQAFDQERRKIKTEINAKEQKLRKEAEEQGQLGNTTARDNLIEQADKVQNQGLLFDAISGAIYGPNTNGATGYIAKAASPFVASKIGTYFKANEAINSIDGGTRSERGSGAHILAQGVLGAAISYATGNDALTGGVSAGTGEATAPLLSKYLYGVDKPSELTAEQKGTVSAITSALGVGNDALTGGVSAGTGEATAPLLSKYLYGVDKPSELTAEQKGTVSAITSALGVGIGVTTGSASDAANAAETSKVAVEDNGLQDIEMMFPNENFRDPNFSRKDLEAIKRLPSEIASVHNYYNDMTIISFSASIVSYTVIINNKNGNTWVTGVEKKDKNGQPYYSAIPEVGINLKLNELAKAVSTSDGKVSRPVGVSASVNFGSIVGGQKKANQIDSVIEGSSVGIQACHGACIGGIYTRSKDEIVTYGIGTSQIGMSGGNMVKVLEKSGRKY